MDFFEVLIFGCVLLPILAAPVPYAMKKAKTALSDGFVTGILLISFLCSVGLALAEPEFFRIDHVFLLGISFTAGGIRSIFGAVCAFLFLASSLADTAYFKGEPRNERYRAFLLLTLGGIQGVFYAGDLLTLYAFFETMSLASWVWVAHNETPKAQKAADTYLAMAMIGGLVMLYGLFLLNHRFGTLVLSELRECTAAMESTRELLVPGFCLLVGFGIKAGMFPFHVWLPKAHPVAPAPSSALLSGILTKSGIYGVLVIITCLLWKNSTFQLVLLALGTVTMVLGAVIAVFSMDLKRTLACSSLSQIGFILVGAAVLTLGEETSLAAGGLMAHAVNHSLTKLILFVSAGVLYKQTHTLDLNKLKGAGRKSLPLLVCFLIGGMSLAGVPLLGGYISKTLLHESIVHQMHFQSGSLVSILGVVEKLFLFSGGLTAAYMSKLFVKIFLQKPEPGTPEVKADRGSLLAIVPPAIALVVMGLIPNFTYEGIAAFAAGSLRSEPIHVAYFTLENLKGAGISLAIGALVYFLVVRGLHTDRKTGAYTPATTVFDLEDDLYRPLLNAIAFVGAMAARVVYSVTDLCVGLCSWAINYGVRRVDPGTDHHFTRYHKHYVKAPAIPQTLQYEFLMFGLGVLFVLVWLAVHL